MNRKNHTKMMDMAKKEIDEHSAWQKDTNAALPVHKTLPVTSYPASALTEIQQRRLGR